MLRPNGPGKLRDGMQKNYDGKTMETMENAGEKDGNIMGHHGINLWRLENMAQTDQTAKKYGKNMGTMGKQFRNLRKEWSENTDKYGPAPEMLMPDIAWWLWLVFFWWVEHS